MVFNFNVIHLACTDKYKEGGRVEEKTRVENRETRDGLARGRERERERERGNREENNTSRLCVDSSSAKSAEIS